MELTASNIATCMMVTIRWAAAGAILPVTNATAFSFQSVMTSVSRPDHLRPLLCFIRNELAKIGRRAAKHNSAELGNPRLQFGIGEACIDLVVELLNDLSGRVLGRTNAEPRARLKAR